LRNSTTCCTAVASAATATPASTRVRLDPPNDAPTAYVMSTATRAPTNAANGNGSIGHSVLAVWA